MSSDDSPVEIIAYSPSLREHFKRLNLEWIERHFVVEQPDVVALSDPDEQIIGKGGHIFFARMGGEIVGTCALKKNDAETYELAKMGVTEKARGKKVGEKLAMAVIAKAREVHASSVILETNSKLTPALNLYRKLGFIEEPNFVSSYKRSDVFMRLAISKDRKSL